jgi:hypothetical protein
MPVPIQPQGKVAPRDIVQGVTTRDSGVENENRRQLQLQIAKPGGREKSRILVI